MRKEDIQRMIDTLKGMIDDMERIRAREGQSRQERELKEDTEELQAQFRAELVIRKEAAAKMERLAQLNQGRHGGQ